MNWYTMKLYKVYQGSRTNLQFDLHRHINLCKQHTYHNDLIDGHQTVLCNNTRIIINSMFPHVFIDEESLST